MLIGVLVYCGMFWFLYKFEVGWRVERGREFIINVLVLFVIYFGKVLS